MANKGLQTVVFAADGKYQAYISERVAANTGRPPALVADSMEQMHQYIGNPHPPTLLFLSVSINEEEKLAQETELSRLAGAIDAQGDDSEDFVVYVSARDVHLIEETEMSERILAWCTMAELGKPGRLAALVREAESLLQKKSIVVFWHNTPLFLPSTDVIDIHQIPGSSLLEVHCTDGRIYPANGPKQDLLARISRKRDT